MGLIALTATIRHNGKPEKVHLDRTPYSDSGTLYTWVHEDTDGRLYPRSNGHPTIAAAMDELKREYADSISDADWL